jgi:eukaryotic-like serine/threonine-protein kinase
MGTVFLAEPPDGRPVAIKMIRSDLAGDAEFRRRFRGEVERAQQVPPFCTAEVLDADHDHDPPYLVVEYVDGPSLAAVVEERGPLSPANLHGLAIGVATALTAIHGAGVIHRDLKPSNVLLAPGSPKVIDFGIARAAEGTTGSTRADQLIGTVAYMAPERFGPIASRALTPAADIFAWGAVVAYAGTGRTPHGADSPPAVAARILTQPPDLDGLVAPLRELVEQALAKNPADRPTARELLDRLLTAGSYHSRDLAVALARQPELLVAAEGAQAVSEQHPIEDINAAAPSSAAVADTAPGGRAALGAGSVHATTRFITPAGDQPADDRPATGTNAAYPAPPVKPPGRSAAGQWSRISTATLALAVVVMAVAVVGIITGVIPLARDRSPGPDHTGTPAQSASPTSSAAPSPSIPADARIIVRDPLTAEGDWHFIEDKDRQASCAFAGALVVTKRTGGSYRCLGPTSKVTGLSDFSVFVDVTLLTPDSCAAVWFRFEDAGYALRICSDGYHLLTHGAPSPDAITPIGTFLVSPPIRPNAATRIGISAQGSELTFYRDGRRVGTRIDTRYSSGRVVLGIFQDVTQGVPFSVSFANIEIWAAPR